MFANFRCIYAKFGVRHIRLSKLLVNVNEVINHDLENPQSPSDTRLKVLRIKTILKSSWISASFCVCVF